MIFLISERQEPQFVPARRLLPIASTLPQPSATEAAICSTPTLKQEQTIRPMDGIGTGERPDRSAMRIGDQSSGPNNCQRLPSKRIICILRMTE